MSFKFSLSRDESIVIVAFVAMAAVFSSFVADDAYIVGRYALNVADGNGLVYNPGQYVSALTSPLHALIESAFAVAGLDPVLTYRILAPVFLVISVLHASRISGMDGSARSVFLFFTLTSPFLALWSVGGLETPILVGLVALFFARVYRIARGDEPVARDFMWLGALSGLAFVTRYDVMIVLGPVMLAIAVMNLKRPALWAGGAVALGIASAWLAFAQAYYGEVIPTSAFVKLYQWPAEPELSVVNVVNFLCATGLVILLPLAGIRSPEGAKSKVLGAVVVLSLLLFLGYGLKSSAEHMMFSYRFFLPYLPVVGFVLAMGRGSRRLILCAGIGVLNLFFAATIATKSINPGIIADLPWGNEVGVEYRLVSLGEYAHFMDVLRQDAEDLREHWLAQQREDEPAIFLYTGGTGYWLPEFHVFETLIDYRHGCDLDQSDQKFLASHYVQDVRNNPVNDAIRAIVMQRPDFGREPLISLSQVALLGDTTIGYKFLPEPSAFRFPPYVDGFCVN